MYPRFFKRPIDLFGSIVILTLTSPLFILTWVLLMMQNKGRAFFIQARPGRNLESFRIIKFKTMTDDRDEHGNLLPDMKRLTRIGALVRMLSLDELPQLLNVLKGDMSLIGPRPLLDKYIPLYSVEQRLRHNVRPGITGWAQVNGRNSISWTEKFKYDIYYVQNISFWLDVKIFYFTLVKVLKREGVNQSADRPMKPFDGRN